MNKMLSGKYTRSDILFIAIIILCCFSCKKEESGNIQHKFLYTTSAGNTKEFEKNIKSESIYTDQIHTGFGDYITSITPKHFSAKLLMMYYLDGWDWNGNMHAVSYIDQLKREAGEEQYIDFSDNKEVILTPELGSKDLIDNVFSQNEVTFIYFVFVPWYIYQELDLPVQYQDIRLSQFDEYYKEWIKPNYPGTQYNSDTIKIGTLLKSRHAPFSSRLFDGEVINNFVFGNTDSTYIFNRQKNPLDPSKDWPFGGSGNRSMVVRSNKFSSPTVVMPSAGETITMQSTVIFDTQNLIQAYAGVDNIPYTSDDILIYAPKFWERINVKLEVK